MPIPQPRGSSRKIISHGIEGNEESRGILVQGMVSGEPSGVCAQWNPQPSSLWVCTSSSPLGKFPSLWAGLCPPGLAVGAFLFLPEISPSPWLEEPLVPCLGSMLSPAQVCAKLFVMALGQALRSQLSPGGCDRSPSDAQSFALLAKCSNLTLYQPCLQQLSVTMTTILTLVMALLWM